MRKQTVFRLLLVLSVITFSLLVLYVFEFVLWFTAEGRKLPPRGERINGLPYSWGQPIHYNRLGFRSHEVEPKSGNTFRIMVLGDSLTWGPGLPVEKRYTNILEQRLNAHFRKGQFEVHNFAFNGMAMLQYAQIFQIHAEIVQPDLVIVGFCYNDPHIKGGGWSPEKEVFDRKFGSFFKKLNVCFSGVGLRYVGARVESGVRNIAERFAIYPDYIESINRTYDPNSSEWKLFVEAIRTIKRLSDEYALPAPIFASLNQGVYSKKPTNYAQPDSTISAFLRWHHQAESVAEQYGYVVINFEREIIEKLEGRSLVLNALDTHPSAKLNEVYAEKLYTVVREVIEKKEKTLTE